MEVGGNEIGRKTGIELERRGKERDPLIHPNSPKHNECPILDR